MVSLPLELYRPIIWHLERNNDLISLALTSHAFRDEAQRVLYRKVHLLEMDPMLGQRRLQAAQVIVFTLLVSSPRVASFVYSLSFESHPDMEDLVPTALRYTANLKRLHVVGLYDPPIRPRSFLEGTSFMLEYFSWHSMLPLTEEDSILFEKQVELRELNLTYSDVDRFNPILPNLRILGFKDTTPRPILLQHNVTHAVCGSSLGGMFKRNDLFPAIKSLKLSNPSSLFHTQQARWFPNLVYLWVSVSLFVHHIHFSIFYEAI